MSVALVSSPLSTLHTHRDEVREDGSIVGKVCPVQRKKEMVKCVSEEW